MKFYQWFKQQYCKHRQPARLDETQPLNAGDTRSYLLCCGRRCWHLPVKGNEQQTTEDLPMGGVCVGGGGGGGGGQGNQNEVDGNRNEQTGHGLVDGGGGRDRGDDNRDVQTDTEPVPAEETATKQPVTRSPAQQAENGGATPHLGTKL